MPKSKKKRTKKVDHKTRAKKTIERWFATIIKGFHNRIDKFETVDDIDEWLKTYINKLMKSNSSEKEEIVQAQNRAVSHIATIMKNAKADNEKKAEKIKKELKK